MDLAATAEGHKAYLRTFLSRGFAALDKLGAIDAQQEAALSTNDEDSCCGGARPGLLGLGPEKAALLLAASTAEASLMSAIYWVSCAMAILRGSFGDELEASVLKYISKCRDPSGDGGFSSHPLHPPHLLPTLSAIQTLAILGQLDSLPERAKLIGFIHSLQLPDGSFCARREGSSEGGSGDCRFVYSALLALSLLGALGEASSQREEARSWLLRCQNLDGGFGCRPDGECESHAGHTFCCLAALRLLATLSDGDDAESSGLSPKQRSRLLQWLCGRQRPDGGLNGRPGKASDVCYTWWTMASIELLLCGGDVDEVADSASAFLNPETLQSFVSRCMSATGGLSAHPDEDPDPFHTFFGLAGLSLLMHGSVDRRDRAERPGRNLERREAGGEGEERGQEGQAQGAIAGTAAAAIAASREGNFLEGSSKWLSPMSAIFALPLQHLPSGPVAK